MAADNDRTLRNVLEKLELLTGERSDGSRRAVLISELNGAIQDLSDQNAVVKKAVRTLEAQFNQSFATITEEMLVRADENSAIAQLITTLKAQVGNNKAEIQDTKRALATKTMAMAEHITTLAASVNSNSAGIVEEKRVRVTENTAFAEKITNLNAFVGYSTGMSYQASLYERLNTEVNPATVGSLAYKVTAATAIANDAKTKPRIFHSPSAPVNDTANPFGVGDLWFDTDDKMKLYKWTGSTWTSIAANGIAAISEFMSSQVQPDGTLINKWAIVANTGGTPGHITFTGVKEVGGTATYNLDIESNVSIKGNLIVTGTIDVNSNGDSPIAQNAVTEGTGTTGTWLAECDIQAKKAGDRFIVIGSYIGGAVSAGNSFGAGGGVAGNLTFDVQFTGYQTFATVPIRGFEYYVGLSCNPYGCANVYYYMTTATTYMAVVTALGAGNHHFRVFTSDSGSLAQGVSIAVIRLSK